MNFCRAWASGYRATGRGRRVLEQSAEQGSVEAWLEGYPEYGSPQRSVSYYLRGELIGYLLDLSIRRRTKNRRSLDDVLRLLNERYAVKGRFYDDTDAIEQAVSAVAGSDMSAVVAALVRRPEPIDWNAYLRYAGYRLTARKKERIDFGLSLAISPQRGIFVSAVEPASAARQAGFRAGDRIIRYRGSPVSCGVEELAALLRRSAGRRVSLGIERQGSFFEIEITPRVTEGRCLPHRVHSSAHYGATARAERLAQANDRPVKPCPRLLLVGNADYDLAFLRPAQVLAGSFFDSRTAGRQVFDFLFDLSVLLREFFDLRLELGLLPPSCLQVLKHTIAGKMKPPRQGGRC